uniref:RNA-dependent RNA polymerase n=1 Tax=Mischke partiti-like virus TaxID=2716652 RepID=A0A6G7PRZ1_9VIRU|nr:RNA-dependent RNA polymerase [Mischke partiti-like virus]
MKRSNYVIEEIIRVMNEIDSRAQNLKKPQHVEDLARGFEVSQKAMSQEEIVQMTPLMKNALEIFGDKPVGDENWKLTVNMPLTKAEKWFDEAIRILLTKFNGPERQYNDNLDLLDKDHYDVQCWSNRHENFRQIQPGQAEERLEATREYTRATKRIGLIQKLRSDPVLQKAVLLVFNQLPEVKASNQFLEINLPFMTKHSNVGYKWWANDRNLVEGTNETYAQMTLKLSEKLSEKDLDNWNISTGYGRNQRKGRLIIAVSRVLNLWLNRLEAVEIAAYKRKSSLFLGYNDDVALKEGLTRMVNYAKQHGLKMRNNDQSRFDRHVSYEWLLLMNAISVIKAQGSLSKQIAMKRAVLSTKTWFVNGLTGKLEEFYGRIFSGFIDTNRGGGIINALVTTYCVMKQDPKYAEHVYNADYYMLVMGDDNNFLYQNLDHKQFEKDMESLGFKVNMDKDEYGPMFLQYRLFQDHDTLVMAYAWVRVVYSMLMKEEGKGLGPAGWYIAWLQQMSKCIEFQPAFKILVNLLIPFDDNHFFTDKSIKEIVAMMNEEDRAKEAEAKTGAQKRRYQSTLDKLRDGDPLKSRLVESIEKGGEGYLADLHEAVKKAVDPNFLKDAGLKVPARKR